MATSKKYWEGFNLPIGLYRCPTGFYVCFSENGKKYTHYFPDKDYIHQSEGWSAACDWLRAARKRSNSWWKTAVRP